MVKKNWIKDAISKPGSLTKTAKSKGLVKKGEKLSLSDLNILAKSKNKTTAKRANLAKTLRSFNK